MTLYKGVNAWEVWDDGKWMASLANRQQVIDFIRLEDNNGTVFRVEAKDLLELVEEVQL